MAGNTSRLESLQAMRGLAALLVVVMHSMNLAAAYSGDGWARSVASALVYVGHFGVDIFFVLSGFVIAGIAAQSESVLTFLSRRAARVYPLFWASLAAMVALPAVPGANNDIATLLSQPLDFLLLQAPRAHPVSWTLTYEVQFYLVTAVLMLAGARLRLAFMVWIVAEVALVAASNYGLVPRFPLSDALSLEFCMGVALALFGQRLTIPRPLLVSALAMTAVISAGLLLGPNWIATTPPARALLWGVPAALLVWSARSAERAGQVFPKWSIFLGDISYSVYMWHLAVFVFVATAIGPGEIDAVQFLIISLPLVLAVSAVSFFWFERPIARQQRPKRIPVTA